MSTFPTVTIPVLINLKTLIDEQKCYETVRQLRWPEGVTCCKCGSKCVVKQGFDETQLYRQRYQRQACQSRFDDLSDAVLAGHHQSLQTWILCLYLMGLNLSTYQIAAELGLNKDDAQQMTTQLCLGIVEKGHVLEESSSSKRQSPTFLKNLVPKRIAAASSNEHRILAATAGIGIVLTEVYKIVLIYALVF